MCAASFVLAMNSCYGACFLPSCFLSLLQTPVELVPLFPLVKHILDAIGCVHLMEPGYHATFCLHILFVAAVAFTVRVVSLFRSIPRCRFEADDVMASLGRWSRSRSVKYCVFEPVCVCFYSFVSY
jgi:hypothetical protein